MNTLSVIIIVLLLLIVTVLIIDRVFNISNKWKESAKRQKEFDKIHAKYKEKLNK